MREDAEQVAFPSTDSLGPCPICGREMVPGASLDRHHWIPRSAGGRDWGWVHRVCHRMIHRVFDDTELAAPFSDAASIRAHPDIARFVKWVRRKPATYVDWPKSPRSGRKGRH